jgi:8-oxo-dGTP pyrophosphatase MutT (NUDIX family)
VFLLVNSKNSGLWGFPKGHVKNGESELDTAKREILEETGISKVKFINDFRLEDVYIIDRFCNIIEKHCVYFLAIALNCCCLDFDKDEILKFSWFDLRQTLELLRFESQKKFINLAYNLINKKYYGR